MSKSKAFFGLLKTGLIVGGGWYVVDKLEKTVDGMKKGQKETGPVENRFALPEFTIKGTPYLFAPALKHPTDKEKDGTPSPLKYPGTETPVLPEIDPKTGKLSDRYLEQLNNATEENFVRDDREGDTKGQITGLAVYAQGQTEMIYLKDGEQPAMVTHSGIKNVNDLRAKLTEAKNRVIQADLKVDAQSGTRAVGWHVKNMDQGKQQNDDARAQNQTGVGNNLLGIPDIVFKIGGPVLGVVTAALFNFSTTGLLVGGALAAGGLFSKQIGEMFTKKSGDTTSQNTPAGDVKKTGGPATGLTTGVPSPITNNVSPPSTPVIPPAPGGPSLSPNP